MGGALTSSSEPQRVAVVTGSGRGIGRAIALALARDGAAVVVNDLAESATAEVVAEIRTAGGLAAPAAGSIASGETATTIVDVAEREFGALDILVNNAGITRDGALHRMLDEDWSAVQEVVLWGPFYMCRAAARLLRGGGEGLPLHHRKVVNIASIAGVYGMVGTANYSAAKAGLIGLTRTLAREWASRRVNVNAVAPGLIIGTGLAAAQDPLIRQIASQIPLGRPGTPEDVAAAVCFLCSSDADYITGQVLELHGGLEIPVFGREGVA
jgi:3-oxoacyl-[acyl-carrier protein] reductase